MAGLVVAMIGVLYLGVLPSRVIDLAQASISHDFLIHGRQPPRAPSNVGSVSSCPLWLMSVELGHLD